ncbi:PAS domain-containing protein [Fulvivirgaceae bacterium PWU4]|uniref:PAS domain-containing protein n=1 Tax=Chryseosolibacter histidini TaxID=2782349 RepID=A0AAP2DQB8_9BACT|nr:PAS domain-containing protein [Chryseosolibacter histidini]MBT1700605.1 PAS domain-containing protein [Chryseosolibacter histidini]
MRKFPYTFIKKRKLESLEAEARQQKDHISTATEFIREIEKGNLDFQLQAIEEQNGSNVLTTSLMSMREQMKKIAQEEKERNWVTEGLAKFVDILRSNNDKSKELAEQIISNLIKYMNANQGALYILNDDNAEDVHLEMAACYAYSRKKHHEHRVNEGEGIIGQVLFEKETVYMTTIPENYIRITSGLGDALPRHLLIVPLKIEDKVFGVVELASFQPIKQYQIEFVERLGESIASTISSVKINQRTKQLLEETQQHAEEMKSQEEEMRQNMEELQATQEEMQRVLKQVQGKETYLNQILNASKDIVYTIDRSYKLVSWNAPFGKTLEYFGMKAEKGLSTIDWYQGEERQKQIDVYDRVLRGESFEDVTSTVNNGMVLHYQYNYTPLRNDKGDVFEAVVFSRDITETVTAQEKKEKILKDAQQQAEQLKAQEEELRQNMEELSTTQEEMQRILNEMQVKERMQDELINLSADSIFTVDRNYRVLNYNRTYEESVKATGVEVKKGMDALVFYTTDEEKKHNKALYDRALAGETFEVAQHYSNSGMELDYSLKYSPLYGPDGKVIAVGVSARDVTKR